MELGQVYNRLGSEISVIEYADRITPLMDSSISRELTKVFKKHGFKFYLNHKVNKVERVGKNVNVKALDGKGQEMLLTADYCLVSVGRKPYTENLGLENLDITLNQNGQIEVNSHLQTSESNIYAIGDVVRGTMLAHKAEEEGVMVAEILAGQKPHIDYNLIPNVIYTWPEAASVGKTEEELKVWELIIKQVNFPCVHLAEQEPVCIRMVL